MITFFVVEIDSRHKLGKIILEYVNGEVLEHMNKIQEHIGRESCVLCIQI